VVNAGRIKDYSAELVKSAPDRFSCLSKWRPRVIRSFGPMSAIGTSRHFDAARHFGRYRDWSGIGPDL
jgi:hypothetical protein